MKELVFQVEFKSDIVLPSTSNTEGKIEQFEYIAGSNFLGMAAKNYSSFSDAFKVFHSGDVRFGDASLLVGDELYYKMPFSLFHQKLDENKIYHHHFLTQNVGQLKQMRKGYISADMSNGLKVKNIEYNYAQKSAYDAKNRRSKTSSMYGYSSIKAGTKWQFVVYFNEEVNKQDIELVKLTLLSSKRLGKSKSSQYGAIEITLKGINTKLVEQKCDDKTILYANSRLALVDNEGNPTYDLSYLLPNLKAEVVYAESQIRTSSFTPYNGAMQTKCYERLIIDKGSVIVLKHLEKDEKEKLLKGVGLYLAEGFGELLVNPPFLMQRNEINLAKKENSKKKKDNRLPIEEKFKDRTVQFLVNRHNESIKKLELANEVSEFIKENAKKYPQKMNSQWGTIRSLCMNNNDKSIKKAVEEYISEGVAKTKWEGDKKKLLLEAIEKSAEPLKFTKLLAIQMPRQKGEKK